MKYGRRCELWVEFHFMHQEKKWGTGKLSKNTTVQLSKSRTVQLSKSHTVQLSNFFLINLKVRGHTVQLSKKFTAIQYNCQKNLK